MSSTTSSGTTSLNNSEAERALLGSIMLDNSSLEVLDGALGPDDFFSEKHRIIFAEMIAMAGRKETIDLVTLHHALNEDELIDASGGAIYLAQLTDGVPLGTKDSVKQYARIVKELSQKREVIQATHELSTAALEGREDEVAVKLQKLAESKAPAKDTRIVYPALPREAWHTLAYMYAEAVGPSTEASDTYHLVCFLTIMGIMLGKTVKIRMGRKFYPNLFMVLVGRAGGGRKDTAVDLATDLMEAVDPNVSLLTTLDSRQGFIKECYELFKDKQAEQKEFDFTFRFLVRFTELRMLIDTAAQKGTMSVVPTLCQIYDGKLPLKRAVAGDDRIQIDNYMGSMLAATSPGWMKNIDLKDLESGLGRRVLFAPGDPKEPKPNPPSPNESMLNSLKMKLRSVIDNYRAAGETEIPLSTKAEKLWSEWYTEHQKKLQNDELISVLSESDHASCRKIALIWAALDQAHTIEVGHLRSAIAFVEWLYECRFGMFGNYGAPFWVEQEQELIQYVKHFGLFGCPVRQVKRRFARWGYETVDRRIKALCANQGGMRVESRGARKLWLVWEE